LILAPDLHRLKADGGNLPAALIELETETMLKRILEVTIIFGATALLAACSGMSEYERHVENWEPVYCYKSIGGVQCYNEPKHSDKRRLVNYYGPAPRTYDAPDAPSPSKTEAPKMIKTWVKDPEPVPQASLAPTPAQVPANAAAVAPGAPAALVKEEEDVSFMDGLMRAMFGKPTLANKPPASTETGTL
jgi:hypothetical protein